MDVMQEDVMQMNKAEQLRLEILQSKNSDVELEKAEKIKAEKNRSEKKVRDLPIDIALAYWLIAEHQKKILQNKYGECKIKLDGSGYVGVVDNAPKEIQYHHLNTDNIDEIIALLKSDGFTVGQKVWVPHWESSDPDYPITGGDWYSVEVSW